MANENVGTGRGTAIPRKVTFNSSPSLPEATAVAEGSSLKTDVFIEGLLSEVFPLVLNTADNLRHV
jgi:hypothetical protein